MNVITATALLMVGLLATGCSKGTESDEPESSSLPEVLNRMQGAWVAASTNGCTSACGVVVDDYSIRVRYQEADGSQMIRESALVERINEEKRILIINGGTGAWEYLLEEKDGVDHLELEFFSRHLEGNWRRMILTRS